MQIEKLYQSIYDDIVKNNRGEITDQTLRYNLLDFVGKIGAEIRKAKEAAGPAPFDFEESIRQYYRDKQKERPERIYVDLGKIIKEAADPGLAIAQAVIEAERIHLMTCPKCGSFARRIEKQLNGKVTCLDCGFTYQNGKRPIMGQWQTPHHTPEFKPGQAVWYKPTDHRGEVLKTAPGIVKRMSKDGKAAFVWYHTGCTAACTPIEYLHAAEQITKEFIPIHKGCEECLDGDPEAIMEVLLKTEEKQAEAATVTKTDMISKMEDLKRNSESFLEEDEEDDIWHEDLKIIPVIIEAIKKHVPEDFKAPEAKIERDVDNE